MSEKKKIFVISDHPMAPSGVGSQTKYFIDALLETGRYKFVCLGGAIKHADYTPQKVEEWGEDFVIHPVDGYGNAQIIRSALTMEKPDVIWFMTDPRFYGWLWDMENEIRPNCPMVYYHVWDNFPPPKFNKPFYDSTDTIVSISKVTRDVVSVVSPEVDNIYLPHAVNSDIFSKKPEEEIHQFALDHFAEHYDKDRVIFFWNNRNARRKMSGSLLWWFNEFAEEVGPEKVQLIMHTDPRDQNGQDLEHIIHQLGADDGRIILSSQKVPPEILSMLYNLSDCTINISDAEGFGLATLESLSCETPIIVNLTGGLQEQVTDGENWFGIGIEPSSKALIGSQTVPYIYEDRVSREDFVQALHTIYAMPRQERQKLGLLGREHVQKNYNFEKFNKSWIELMDKIIEEKGSWDSRVGYKPWHMKEIA
jgi:glycosyltransferase involved in cell wall biosynthesis